MTDKPKTKRYTFTFEIRHYYQIEVEDTDEAEAYDKALDEMHNININEYIASSDIELEDTLIEVLK